MKKDNEWHGPQDGRPPVGTECEGKHHMTSNGWFKCVINGYQRNKVWFEEHLDTSVRDFVYPVSAVDFRSIHSDRDKVIDLVKGKSIGTLYDEGWLRTPISRETVIYKIARLIPEIDTAQAMSIADMLGYKE